MARLPSSRISPTAHYTGHVWLRHSLSHAAFATRTGRLFYNAMRPFNRLSSLLGGVTLEKMLLARHRVIDDRLARAIDDGTIGQVLEVAAGLSPRGYRFAERFPHLIYVEADLPEMAAHKRSVLEATGSLGPRHLVVAIDALADAGEQSIVAVCERLLDRDRGTAIITEGLMSYFPPDLVRATWRRFADALSAFPRGLYLSDLSLDDDIRQVRGGRLFRRTLNQVTRGEHHTYFEDVRLARAALLEAGFSRAELPYAAEYSRGLVLDSVEKTGRVRIVIAER